MRSLILRQPPLMLAVELLIFDVAVFWLVWRMIDLPPAARTPWIMTAVLFGLIEAWLLNRRIKRRVP